MRTREWAGHGEGDSQATIKSKKRAIQSQASQGSECRDKEEHNDCDILS